MKPGSRIGPYEVVSSIGAGGMGEVFRARDTRLSRDVAIKILPAAFAKDSDRVARFKREAQILASLQHPNIAGIHGLEEDPSAGTLALAMEFVDGEDLAARLRRGPVPCEDALAIAAQVAAGLEEAHEHGIVHRDLKPANVKVTPEGKVKVLDFGLAKALDSGPSSASSDLSAAVNSPTMTHHQTAGGMIVGTAPYMSPEQARGKKVDKRSDIWSFGVLLFEMLTGQRLFKGETVSDTLAAVLREEIPWPALPADVPPGARHLLRRCLERDPSKRLRDIGEARLLLAGDATTVMTPAGPTAFASRRDVLRLGLAGAAGVAGGVLLRSAWPGRPAGVEPQILASRELTESGNVISVGISPDGRFISYVESEQGQQSLWLQQIESGQTLRLVPERAAAYWGNAFTPDGNSIIFGLKTREDPKGALYSIPTLGGTPRRIIGDIDSAPTFSPDGRRMAFSRQSFPSQATTSIIVAGVDGSGEKTLATFQEPERVAGIFFGGPAWSPDGASIATAVVRLAQDGVEPRAWLVSISVAEGRVTKLSDPGWDRAAQCGYLPDGRSLLVIAATPTQREAQMWKVQLPGGDAYPVFSDTDDHRIISLTRDGTKLATVVGDISSTASMVSVDDPSRLRRISRGRLEGIGGSALTRDRAVFATQAGGDWAIVSVALDGSIRETLYRGGPDERFADVAAARDGDVFFNARSGRGREVRRLRAGAQAAERIAASRDEVGVSRDGRYLFYTTGTPAGVRLIRHDLQSNETKVFVDAVAFMPSVDIAGERVAFYMATEKGFRIGMCRIDGGPLLFDVPAEPVTAGTASLVLGRKVVYTNTILGDRANVWALPLDGGAPRRVTSFGDQILFNFDFTEDEKSLLVVRGPRVRDANLVTGF